MREPALAGTASILEPGPGHHVAATRLSYVEPSALAHFVVFLSVFVLNYNVPPNWFVATVDPRSAAVDAPQGYVGAILVVTALIGLATMGHHLEILLTIARREPLLPLFLLLMNASVLWSSAPLSTLRFVASIDLVVFIGYWVAAHFKLRNVLLIVCTAYAIGTVINYIWVIALPRYGQSTFGASGVFDNKNEFGRIAVVATLHFVLAVGVFPRFRVFWMLMAASAAGQVLLSQSMTSLGTLLLVLTLMFVFKTFRARSTLYGAVGVSMIASSVLAVLVATANLGPITSAFGKDITLTGRTALWRDTLRLGAEHPLLGHGWAGFWQGWFGPSQPIISTYQWRVPHAHNALIEYFLALGIVGVVCFVALFVRFFVRSTRTVGSQPGPLGMWPLMFASFAALFSITEAGVVGRDGTFFLFVVLVVAVSFDHPGRERVSRGTPDDL